MTIEPRYIRYEFPTQTSTTTSEKPAITSAKDEPQNSQPPKFERANNSSSLDLEFDPNLGSVSHPPPIRPERVKEWIDNNTGEDGGDSGDWKPAAEHRKKNKRHADRNVESSANQNSLNVPGALPGDQVGRPANSKPRDAHGANERSDVQSAHITLVDQTPVPTDHIATSCATHKRKYEIRKYMSDAKATAEPGSWLAFPEIPSSIDVMYTPPDNTVPRNRIYGAWDSKEEYLEAHHRLVWEDAVFPMRAAVRQIHDYPDMQEDYFNGSIGIYDHVRIIGLTCDNRGIALRVSFWMNRVGKRVKWVQSKRLIAGSMVALTPATDMFQSKCVIATVAARGLRGVTEMIPPEIDLYIPRSEELEIDPSIEWIMIEERGAYFEASRHVLTALRKLSKEPFPLQEHIVRVEKKVVVPQYIERHSILDLSMALESNYNEAYENVDIVQDWPKKPTTSLDTSQLTALRRILSKKLAIIQGPPGTGKTHVSVVALQIMLANWQPGDPPIIVSCQTNHALDQLLRHVAVFESQFVRLGGRSKDTGIVKERTLYMLRKAKGTPPRTGGLKATSAARMRDVTGRITALLEPLATGSKLLLDPQIFKELGLLTEAQCQSLEDGDQEWTHHASNDADACQTMEHWLGKQLLIVPRHIHPDDRTYGYEDADMESEALEELEAEAKPLDEFDDELHGKFCPINDTYAGQTLSRLSDSEIEAILQKTSNLYRVPNKQRGSVYAYLQRQIKTCLLKAVREEAETYVRLAGERQIGVWEHDLSVLSENKLIGVTTTGLSKYRPMISALHPRVVLIEEAAETIEAPVAVACVPSLEHLIMVGDHQQLRPQCSVKAFEGAPFNLNVSMFERMVRNEVEYSVIRRQRRMIPEMRRLLEPIYGPGVIKDHEVVKSAAHRPPVPGMGGVNSYFFCHDWQETRDENMSACNVQEAKMLVEYFNYLVLNGMPRNDITVITFYNGQRKALHQAFRKHPNLRGSHYKIATVDSYQGEENEIILLSLTRSNEQYNVGFLKVVNRICVALSRAKRGFYLFGNAEILCGESNTWQDVVKIMWGKMGEKCPEPLKRIGFYMPLKCQKHDRVTLAEDADDFAQINGGGCTIPCDGTLPCEHPCLLRCHPFAHEEVLCKERCARSLDCGHTCQKFCFEACYCAICEEVDVEQVRSLEAPLRRIEGAGPAMPSAYGLSGTTAINSHTSPINASDAWTSYATNGVQAHDRELMSNPHATFDAWNMRVTDQSKSRPSQPLHEVPATSLVHRCRSMDLIEFD